MFDQFSKSLNSFWRLQLAGWTLYLILIYITFLTVAQPGRFLSLFYLKGFRAVVGFCLTSILWRGYRKMVSRFSISSIVLTVITLSIAAGILWTSIETVYVWQTTVNFDFYDRLPRLPRVALDYSVTVMAWSAIYFGIKYWQQWQRERENSLEATILAEKAQIEMLRYQLNPHFLFNALNSIRASVDEDALRAKQMITSLSEFLRHSLLSGEAKEISLGEEIEAVKNYLAIEKIRFEEKLEVDFEVDDSAAEFKVPCFLLNPLVENAVKHGLMTSDKPLKLKIAARFDGPNLLIEVANSGKLNNESNGTGIGLRNVRERLEKLFPDRSRFTLNVEDGFVVARIEIRTN